MPVNGDIVIAKEQTDGTVKYTIGIVPNPAQLRCESLEHALATARSWAARKRNAIWFTENNETFRDVTHTSVAASAAQEME